MTHEYFPVRIRKAIEKSTRPSAVPTFSAGTFLPDLMNELKSHLRKIELAQIASVQEYKEVVRTRNVVGTSHSKYMDQIRAARKASK